MRKSRKRKPNIILIVCEGKTEINYFNKLRVDIRIPFKIITRSSHKKNPLNLVKYCKEYMRLEQISTAYGDKIYCVFDRDNNTEEDLQKAKKHAKGEIELIQSNPSFEYWVLCHFEYYPKPIEKDELKTKLKKYLDYDKSDPELYNKIKEKQGVAKKNAKKANNTHKKKKMNVLSIKSNPSTKIYQIVDDLKNLKK